MNDCYIIMSIIMLFEWLLSFAALLQIKEKADIFGVTYLLYLSCHIYFTFVDILS